MRVLVSDTDGQAAKKLLGHIVPVSSQAKPPNAFQRWLFTLLGGNK
ncbi:MAG: hypothetical protein HY050_06810 [Actinobacteria bacterium]|nr:hypothetical protein [Actinomycetota bacterium]